MRIIAGERRGHNIDGPKGQGTRPTSDMVRESVFNILGDLVVDRTVVDLFAGTGALGLEALSRGAARAVFVEQNRENVALIRRNLAKLRYEDSARILATNAYRWAHGFVAADGEPIVVLIDPPYRDYEQHPRRVRQLLDDLLQKLPGGSVIALESGRVKGLDEQIFPDLEAWDVRRYGRTQLSFRSVPDHARDGPTEVVIPEGHANPSPQDPGTATSREAEPNGLSYVDHDPEPRCERDPGPDA